MSTEPDGRLIERALAGDQRALSELAGRARALARRVLARQLISSDDREDCAQEVALRVVARLGQLREPARFDGWVATIARHVAFAKQRDNATLPLPFGLTPLEPQADPVCTSPETELDRARRRLGSARQDLLALRYRQGLSYAEIAQRLRTTVPIVRRRLQGARDQLRKEVMRVMASKDGKAVHLNRADLDCLRAAARLADPASEREFHAVHFGERRVFGGTTHRAALGTLSCRRKLPLMAVEAAPLAALTDHTEANAAALGWDDEEARLVLDDGAIIQAARVSTEPLDPGAWEIAAWPFPHQAEASRAELLELAELIAAAAWGWGRESDPNERAQAAFTVSPNLISAVVFRAENVSFMMSGSIGAMTEGGKAVQFFLNRAYLRACLAALPPTAERVRLEYGEPLQALRFSCPDQPQVVTVMMPRQAPEGVDFRMVTSGDSAPGA